MAYPRSDLVIYGYYSVNNVIKPSTPGRSRALSAVPDQCRPCPRAERHLYASCARRARGLHSDHSALSLSHLRSHLQCTAHTWAVGWLWPQAYHWTWKRCHQWLAAHQIDGGRPIRPVKIRQQEVSRTPLIRHRREQLGTVPTPSYKGHEFFPFLGSELTLSVMITRVQPVAGLRGAAVRLPRSTDRLSAFLADDRNLPEY